MDADTVRRLSPALTIKVLVAELSKMPPDSLVVFKAGDVCHAVTDAEELFPDESLVSTGVPRGLLRFVEDEDYHPTEDDPGVVVLT